MLLYHRTTEENWKKIQQDGYLCGKRGGNYGFISLSEEDWGEHFSFYGWKTNVLLQVNYEFQGWPKDQYRQEFIKERDQVLKESPNAKIQEFKVFVPIPLCNVKRLI